MPVSKRPQYTAMIGAAMGGMSQLAFQIVHRMQLLMRTSPVTLVMAPFLGGVLTDKVSWSKLFSCEDGVL
jgi:hypothetical protein